MPCTPLVIGAGLFINNPPSVWSSAPSANQGGKTVTLTAAGINVAGPAGQVFHVTVGGWVSRYMFFSPGAFLLLLDMESGAGAYERRVSLVDFTTTPPSERSLLDVLAISNTIGLPVVQYSQGGGGAFAIYAPTGNVGAEISGLAVYRSDNGFPLCIGPTPYSPRVQLTAEATASQIRVKDGGTVLQACPLPKGSLQVIGSPQTFADVVIGGCATSPSTRQFTLRNNGTDCLTVGSITNAPPFSVSGTSKPLPAALAPGDTVVITVTFAPTVLGVFGPVNLAVTRTPAVGDASCVCQGRARGPNAHISFDATSINFGSIPVGTSSANRSLIITNTGERQINVSLPSAPSGSPFHWAGFTGSLTCGASRSMPIVFSPTNEGTVSTNFSVTSDAPGSPTTIQLSGTGCVANAVIAVPAAFPSFGSVERGSYAERSITIRNEGDGLLTFSAHIVGNDAALYALEQPTGNINNVVQSRDYEVDPQSPCGALPSGSGEGAVGVVFFANDVPRVTSAELVIDNHNATNAVPPRWSFALTGEIVPLKLRATINTNCPGTIRILSGHDEVYTFSIKVQNAQGRVRAHWSTSSNVADITDPDSVDTTIDFGASGARSVMCRISVTITDDVMSVTTGRTFSVQIAQGPRP